VEQAKAQDLLKRPTEVTAHEKVSEKTQYLDEKGKPLRLSDLRAGVTVWAVSSGGRDGPSAIWICNGQMTLAALTANTYHRLSRDRLVFRRETFWPAQSIRKLRD
jgi:hypothetical protein